MHNELESVLKNYRQFLETNCKSEMADELFFNKLMGLLKGYKKPHEPEVAKEPCHKCGKNLVGLDIVAWKGGLYCSYLCVILKAELQKPEDIRNTILECEELHYSDISTK